MLKNQPLRLTLCIIYGSIFVAMMSPSILTPLLPMFVIEHGGTGVHQGLLFFGFYAMQFVGSLIIGRLTDFFGRRASLMYCMYGGAFAVILVGFSPDLTTVILLRSFAGLFAGSVSSSQAAVTDLTPPAQRAARLGLVGASIGLAHIIGPLLGAPLSALGLQWAGCVAFGFFFSAAVAVTFLMPETMAREKTGYYRWKMSRQKKIEADESTQPRAVERVPLANASTSPGGVIDLGTPSGAYGTCTTADEPRGIATATVASPPGDIAPAAPGNAMQGTFQSSSPQVISPAPVRPSLVPVPMSTFELGAMGAITPTPSPSPPVHDTVAVPEGAIATQPTDREKSVVVVLDEQTHRGSDAAAVPPAAPAPDPATPTSLGGVLTWILHTPRLLCAYLGTMCVVYIYSGCQALLPVDLETRFGGGAVAMSILWVIQGVCAIVVQGLLVKWVVKRFGEQLTILVGALAASLAVLALALAPSSTVLWGMVVVFSFSYGFINPANMALFASFGSECNRGTVMGLVQSVSSISRAMAPLISGSLYDVLPLSAFALIAAMGTTGAFTIFLGVKKLAPKPTIPPMTASASPGTATQA
ncbi:putative MFS transporter [Paratrimastix pyriformis]|uniref:MFS transporter n=1 Tax=Paratrimastix pyriformis TaxID=342808 RepID=A0ABQ8U7U0_9EUKA|nr:putative MFS transporter [Paratrimastix pyriformis]